MTTEFTDLIPVVVYRDIRAAHDFLVDVLGLASGGLVEDGHGRVIHGEVRAGQSRIWLHQVTDEHALTSPAVAGHATGHLVIQVSDVDAHDHRTQAAGAAIESEPRDEDYGQREYSAHDPEGHLWGFATPFAQPASRSSRQPPQTCSALASLRSRAHGGMDRGTSRRWV